MIGYLKGRVLENTEGKMLVIVGTDESAVGYSVAVPQSASYGLIQQGTITELFIYTHVREDALDLYGFISAPEKELFMTLLGVSGIGPKGAMGILAGAEPVQLIEAITMGDKAFLTSIPGIGKKTAERVVLELADSLRKKMETGSLAVLRATPSALQKRSERSSELTGAPQKGEWIRDAKSALIGLGYRESEIVVLLNRLANDSEKNANSAEALIRFALRELGKGQ